jgi:hypothetical protein
MQICKDECGNCTVCLGLYDDEEHLITYICRTCGDEYEPGDLNYCCYGCFIIAGEEKDVK